MLSGFIEKTATDRATIIVDAPPGELGLRFVNSPFGPTVDAVAPGSPLDLAVAVGWRLLKVDSVTVSKLDCHAATTVLRDKQAAPTRVCAFLDPVLCNACLRGGTPTSRCVGRVAVEAPAGRLGIELHGDSCPTVASLRKASPIVHSVGVGWRAPRVQRWRVRTAARACGGSPLPAAGRCLRRSEAGWAASPPFRFGLTGGSSRSTA